MWRSFSFNLSSNSPIFDGFRALLIPGNFPKKADFFWYKNDKFRLFCKNDTVSSRSKTPLDSHNFKG